MNSIAKKCEHTITRSIGYQNLGDLKPGYEIELANCLNCRTTLTIGKARKSYSMFDNTGLWLILDKK